MKLPDYQIGDKFYYYNRFRKSIDFGEITEWKTTRGWCCQERGSGGVGVPQIRYKMKSGIDVVWIEEKYLSKNKENLEKFLTMDYSQVSRWIFTPEGKPLREY